MRTSLILAGMACAILAAPASANLAPKQSGKDSKASEPVYCIEYEGRTGSRLREKACLTKKEWAKRGVDVDNLDGR